MKFLDLNASADNWAEEILSISSLHIDTSEIIKLKGYDTDTNAYWMENFYLNFVS